MCLYVKQLPMCKCSYAWNCQEQVMHSATYMAKLLRRCKARIGQQSGGFLENLQTSVILQGHCTQGGKIKVVFDKEAVEVVVIPGAG